jgi:hypothetical protein
MEGYCILNNFTKAASLARTDQASKHLVVENFPYPDQPRCCTDLNPTRMKKRRGSEARGIDQGSETEITTFHSLFAIPYPTREACRRCFCAGQGQRMAVLGNTMNIPEETSSNDSGPATAL